MQCLALIGPEPAVWSAGKPGEASDLFLILLMQSFLMTHLTCGMMVCHITQTRYVAHHSKLSVAMAAASLLLCAIWIIAPSFFEKNVNLHTVLWIMLGGWPGWPGPSPAW